MAYVPKFMSNAIKEANIAYQDKEAPIGAVIVNNGKIIASAHNLVMQTHDPTAHAEILALRIASSALATDKLSLCDIYVTLEPCPMCMHAIEIARIKNLYFGAYQKKTTKT